jgi:very-short-patch-repair endonuclease
VRLPAQVVENGLATCLDTTLLVCAALEQCGLNPLVVFTKGHAFAGVWLKAEEFSTVLMDDITALRKRAKLKELILFETTLLAQRPAVPFSRAVEKGTQQISESEDDAFELAVDIRRARLQRIRPLASTEVVPIAGLVEAESLEPVFENAPELPDDSIIADDDGASGKLEDRLQRWQRKLLDLSLRNSLLNFRATKKAIRLDAPAPGRLEDLLADGTALKLLPHPVLMDGNDPRSQFIHESRTNEDLRREHALDALKRKEIFVPMNGDELDSRLIELYRSARSTLQDGGANTLFVALGFLSWTKDCKDDKRYRAPLILIPVTLKRKSVRSGFLLTIHDDEPRFNPTLIEMLRQDYKLTIPIAEGELPKDDSGLDVDGIWRAVSHAIKEIAGWEVVEDVVLSTFSFAKYLMWKDLVDRTEQLKQNPVVRHLIDTPRDPYPSTVAFPNPRELDATHGPEQTFCPLPADSSQLSAVMAAAGGKDFVLVGPPGTGKSQTIANLIAQCLAEKKTVLFVAEKIAALDVVHRRLRDVGLGDFCLELHSNKARKLDVLQQLGRAWDARGGIDAAEWQKEAIRLKGLRESLNAFVNHLHKRRSNGLAAYDAIGRVVAGAGQPVLGLSWPSPDSHDAEAMDALRDLAERLDVNANEVGSIVDSPLALIAHDDWSAGWQQSILSATRNLLPRIDELESSAEAFRQATGLPEIVYKRQNRESLNILAEVLPEAAGKDWRFVLRPDARAIGEGLAEGAELLSRYERVTGELSAEYREEVFELDLNHLKSERLNANSVWFLKAWLMRRGVRKTLGQVTSVKEITAIDADIDKLIELKSLRQSIDGLSELEGKTSGLWCGLKSRHNELTKALAFQKALSEAIAGLASSTEELVAIKAAIERLLGDGNMLLEPTGPVVGAGSAYRQSLEQFNQARSAFAGFAGIAAEQIGVDGRDDPEVLKTLCREITALEPKLHAWCFWRKARGEAVAKGLEPLVVAVENGTVPLGSVREVFETDYCRWWINAMVDADDILRGFVSAEHEKRIADFKALDEHFTSLTRAYVRAGLCAELPDQESVGRNSEWGILRHEMQKKKRHLPLRELMNRIPNTVTQLAPCLLMSPLSIAQYLSTETATFDVVVFDEASQIPVWDAVGAMARGKQVVMVGDPKQLPPTSFFDRAESDLDDEDVEGDLESILDECMGANLPTLALNWHYRSRHESLIAFSNHRYYGGGLVTFPSPVTEDRAVNFNFIEAGVYEKGGARINQPEAKAVVADIVARLKEPSFRASEMTVGVVTFNSEQQRLIEDLLDEERRKAPSIERYFSEDALEPVFVKNLESVQGDERDIMYFSTTFGPDHSGAVSMNFGPMNRDGGERRLNVAVTRARHELRVFASLKPEQIDLSRTKAEGVRDLKHFLEFAERGPRALAEAVFGTVGDFDSPFEQAVAERLGSKGWQVHPQVGVSSFRIDLGVVDPEAPGSYLAGVECDGATYHRSATARDRDKLREQVLRGLGWEILRIWSTDWWHDASGALDKVHARLETLLEEARTKRSEEAERQATLAQQHADAESNFDEDSENYDGADEAPQDDMFNVTYARNEGGGGDRHQYKVSDPLDAVATPDPDSFFDVTYNQTLAGMITHVVEIEGPVREDLLAKCIARAHGWTRTGARIRDRVLNVAKKAFVVTEEDAGLFVWPSFSTGEFWDEFRRPGSDDARTVDEISMPELVALAREVARNGLSGEDAVTYMAREVGLKKLMANSRERLERALNLAVTMLG